MRIRTDAFQIIQFILSFIHDDMSAGTQIRFSPEIFGRSTTLTLFVLDQDEIELTLRDCCKYILQQLCQECHQKFRLHKDNQKPRIPILASLRLSLDQLLTLLNYTTNRQKIDLINDLCFNVALYNGDDTMLKYLQYVFTHKTPVRFAACERPPARSFSSQLDVLQDIYLEFEYYHPNCPRRCVKFDLRTQTTPAR